MAQVLLNKDTVRSLNEMGTIIGNERYFLNIFDTFQESFRSDLDAIETYIRNTELDKVRILAHRMKSSAKTIGAAALGDIFYDIEAQIVQGNIDLNKLQGEMSGIRSLYQQTLQSFHEYLN
ncbi:MAG: Hpt domain-containing protein [Oligoflexus sp.]